MDISIPPALARRLASLQSNRDLAESGRKLVKEGIVAIQGFPEAEIDLLADWAANPFGNRSWQWAVAAFRFLPGVIAYHASSRDEAALQWAIDALRSWDGATRRKLRKYEFARNDHAVAIQAENLVYLLAHLQMLGARGEDREQIAAFIHRQADLLATEDFYSRHTNHGIEQARILGVIADFFPDDSRSSPRMALAVERLTAELEFAFTKEGVHVENSPGYHCYVCLSFIKILDYFSPESLGELAERIETLLPRAIRFLTHVTRPDGTLPLIGDTVEERPADYFRRFRKTRDYTHFSYARSDGASGARPASTSAIYPQAGYFIARDAWQAPGEGRNAFHLIFRCGFRSGYHRHDDDLNIVLYCAGEDWLIDSGAYNYVEQDPLRRYMRSKWAHNVPVPYQAPERRWRWDLPPAVLPLLRLPSVAGALSVRGVSHSYPGHLAIRDVHVNAPGREFTVVDTLVQTAPPVRKRYLSLWHVPADKSVHIEGQKVQLVSASTGNRLEIDNIGRVAKSIALMDPEVAGVTGAVASRIANRVEPVQLLAFEWAASHLHATLRFRWRGADQEPES